MPCLLVALAAQPVERGQLNIAKQFSDSVHPFIRSYCSSCHGKEKPQAQLDLTSYSSVDSVSSDLAHWSSVLDKLAAKQMPPPRAAKQPSASERENVIA